LKVTREFEPANRYVYDFGVCNMDNGFAQVDSSQDASYFGTWCNPTKRIVVNYCEGDVTIHECDTDAELVTVIREMHEWNVAQGFKPVRIDPGSRVELAEAFEKAGLAEFLHDGGDSQSLRAYHAACTAKLIEEEPQMQGVQPTL
jgi:hypothetical protein